MKVLILGSGGREHAFAWKVAQSNLVEKIFCLPGNEGVSFIQKVSRVSGSVTDIPYIVSKAKELSIDLVIVGPEDPLSLGVSDALEKEGIKVFGPSKEAAQLEASKVFSKNFMMENNIPTAKAFSCETYESAMAVLDSWDFNSGVVIKADELAAGKGVVVTDSEEEARKTIFDFMKNPECTVKTKKVLIEEKLIGKKLRHLPFVTEKTLFPLVMPVTIKEWGTMTLALILAEWVDIRLRIGQLNPRKNLLKKRFLKKFLKACLGGELLIRDFYLPG